MEYQITKKDNLIVISFTDFILKYKPLIPLFQREFIEERINYFFNKILEYLIKNNDTLPFLNLIHTISFENKCYILDGQHRYFAYKKYYDTYKKDFNIIFCQKICETSQEVKEYFIDLNNNYQLHDLILDENDLDKSNEIKRYIKIKYGKHLSNSESPRFPNVNLDQLTKYFIDIYKELPSKTIIEKIETLNIEIKEQLKETNYDLYDQSTKKQQFYIGYIFMKSETENKRKHIPKCLRHKLWRTYFDDKMNGNCYVCNTGINIENFHAGHITSVKNGGDTNINNLRVVCSLCNLSMGSKNLEDFKNKYF